MKGGESVPKEAKIYYLNSTDFNKNYKMCCQRKIILDIVKFESKTLFLEVELNSKYNRDSRVFIINWQGLKITKRNLIRY